MIEWKSEGFAFGERASAGTVGGFHHKHAEAESPQTVRRSDAGAAGPNDDYVWCRRRVGGFHERLIKSLLPVVITGLTAHRSVNRDRTHYVEFCARNRARSIDSSVHNSTRRKRQFSAISGRVAVR